jgi:hypothetical protein
VTPEEYARQVVDSTLDGVKIHQQCLGTSHGDPVMDETPHAACDNGFYPQEWMTTDMDLVTCEACLATRQEINDEIASRYPKDTSVGKVLRLLGIITDPEKDDAQD